MGHGSAWVLTSLAKRKSDEFDSRAVYHFNEILAILIIVDVRQMM